MLSRRVRPSLLGVALGLVLLQVPCLAQAPRELPWPALTSPEPTLPVGLVENLHDWIHFSQAGGAGPRQVQLEFTTGRLVQGATCLQVRGPDGAVLWEAQAQGQRDEPLATVLDFEALAVDPAGVRLVFAKGATPEACADVYAVSDLSGKLGKKLAFRWIRDRF